jgi:hypothetical protein
LGNQLDAIDGGRQGGYDKWQHTIYNNVYSFLEHFTFPNALRFARHCVSQKVSGQTQKGIWPNQKGPLLIDCLPIWLCEKNPKTT